MIESISFRRQINVIFVETAWNRHRFDQEFLAGYRYCVIVSCGFRGRTVRQASDSLIRKLLKNLKHFFFSVYLYEIRVHFQYDRIRLRWP